MNNLNVSYNKYTEEPQDFQQSNLKMLMEDFIVNDKEVEGSSGEKRVEIEENPPIPLEKEVVEKAEKEATHVTPPPYKPLIPFP